MHKWLMLLSVAWQQTPLWWGFLGHTLAWASKWATKLPPQDVRIPGKKQVRVVTAAGLKDLPVRKGLSMPTRVMIQTANLYSLWLCSCKCCMLILHEEQLHWASVGLLHKVNHVCMSLQTHSSKEGWCAISHVLKTLEGHKWCMSFNTGCIHRYKFQ